MRVQPRMDEVRRIAATEKYKVLPVSCEVLSDIVTPIEAMRILKNVSTHCYMLESVAEKEKWGRYTFLGFDPKLEITCINGEMKVGDVTFRTENPSAYLRQICENYKSLRLDYLPSFTGGLVGYFSYDYLAYSEPAVRCDAEDTEAFKDVDLMLFDKVIAFDNFRQKIVLIVNMALDDVEAEYNRAVMGLKQLTELLRCGERKKEDSGRLLGEVTPLFDKETYCRMVEKAKHHIREGDIFQIVLSNRLSAPFQGSLFDTYRVLRTINPSPYMFYFSGTDVEVAGADCISVLTEPKWFLGRDEYLREIASKVSVPCLRKDFTVDEYMLYEAKLLGASAVLLIVSILTEEQIQEYIGICDALGLSALVEAHNGEEVDAALRCGARVIGVNNRNLKDCAVDTENSRRLRQRIPTDILFVSESGVSNAQDIDRLREIGADAVLIGETLMRAADRKAKLRELRGGI